MQCSVMRPLAQFWHAIHRICCLQFYIKRYPKLLSPIAVGRQTLRNRVIMGSMHTRLEYGKDAVAKLAAFYAERARGGVALRQLAVLVVVVLDQLDLTDALRRAVAEHLGQHADLEPPVARDADAARELAGVARAPAPPGA